MSVHEQAVLPATLDFTFSPSALRNSRLPNEKYTYAAKCEEQEE